MISTFITFMTSGAIFRYDSSRITRTTKRTRRSAGRNDRREGGRRDGRDTRRNDKIIDGGPARIPMTGLTTSCGDDGRYGDTSDGTQRKEGTRISKDARRGATISGSDGDAAATYDA